jgi:hypothetical protein
VSRLDGMDIRVDWDIGFSEDRQYGRGKSGGQVRDEHRRGEEEAEAYAKFGNGNAGGHHRQHSMDKMLGRRREPFEVSPLIHQRGDYRDGGDARKKYKL